ncbi:MFS transporter [Arthrobacter cupressi]|uniref:Sugar phosphate permease n=1 Tax=Arthrobacter cupressi TaxID=1045773 RepID=A0A1G8VWY1_9MICC|nr:MFS transporter [Arthrobacter cupressi]NYD78592.1 sugar phosphate permease [Arthrobacter cupressi]SDJ70327.1 Sugar phosphate permease [Arthrobacter cupressi]
MSDFGSTETSVLQHEKQSTKTSTKRQELFKWQIRIFALSWLAYAAFYFPRSAFSAAKVGILDEGFLSRQTLGVLDSVYLAAYAVGQFIWGAVAERFGTRIVVAGGMVMAGVAALFMGIAPAVWLFVPLMIVQGLAQSTGWSGLCKNIASFFTVRKRGRAMGLFSTSYAFGGLVATPFTGWIAYSIFDSWRWAFFAGTATIAVALVLFAVFQRNNPQEVGLPGIDEDDSALDGDYVRSHTRAPVPVVKVKGDRFSPRDLLAAAKHDAMVLKLGIVYFLLKPARYAILLWGPVLVLDALPHLDSITAVMVPVAFGITGLIAPIVVGWTSDTLFNARRVPPSVLCLGLLVIALVLWQPVTSTGSLPLFVGLLSFVGLTVYGADAMVSGVAAVDFGTSKYAAGATGFINGCGSLGAILGGLLPGFFPGVVIFYVFAAAALAAALILIPSWNKRPSAA